jgi:hypothetical protein
MASGSPDCPHGILASDYPGFPFANGSYPPVVRVQCLECFERREYRPVEVAENRKLSIADCYILLADATNMLQHISLGRDSVTQSVVQDFVDLVRERIDYHPVPFDYPPAAPTGRVLKVEPCACGCGGIPVIDDSEDRADGR